MIVEEIIAWGIVAALAFFVVAVIIVFVGIFALGTLSLGKEATPKQYIDDDETEQWLRSEDDEDELDEAMGEPIDLLEEED